MITEESNVFTTVMSPFEDSILVCKQNRFHLRARELNGEHTLRKLNHFEVIHIVNLYLRESRDHMFD